MAKWLDKYEQGGMVLKKKIKDNYGSTPNANAGYSTAGPGWVGEGTTDRGFDYNGAWGGTMQDGGILSKRFLQPNDPKLPKGWNPKEKGYSTEYSTTIGKDGEYYLVPGFKHGKLLSDPEKEFHNTGELLGGPFKTIQSAEDFANRRHKYVEQGKPIPSPMKTYDEFQMGGSMPGAVGFTYARTAGAAPSNGKYAKKTLASAQDGKVLSGSDPAKKKIYGAPEEDKINDWFKQYYGSDFFKQNLTDASKGIINIDPNEISKNAINAIDNTEVIYPKTDESMTYSFPSGGKQYIVMGNPNVYGNQPRNETYAHEVGHTAGLDLLANQPKNLFFMDNHAIGKKEYADQLYKDLLAPIENRYPDGPKFKSDDEKRKSVLRHYAQEEEDLGMRDHGKAQTEQRADIMALRYLAAKKGIWDATKSKPGSFTADMLNKLYKTKELNTPVTRQSTMGFGTRTDEIDPQDIKQGNLKNVAPPKSPGVILPELRRKFSDKDILYLMNKLAKNEGDIPMDQAENGMEMKYYQDGLDFKPKTISKNGSVIKDDRGQWAHPGEITEIGSPDITMQGVDYPVLGISDTGDTQMMYPDQDYKFDGNKVTEYPMAQDGKKFSMKDVKKNAISKKYPSAQEMSGELFQDVDKSLIQGADIATDLMQLGNFIPHPIGQSIGKAGNIIGGWLDAYQAANALDEGNYGDAAINLASVALPMALGSNTFKRNSKYLQKGQPLNFLKGKKRVNYIEPFTNVKGMTNKSLMANRALLGTLGAETVYDSKKNGGSLNKYK